MGRLLTALHVGNDIALVDACTLLGVNLNQLATKGCGQFDNLTVRILNVAEAVALVVFLANKRFDALYALAVAANFP